MKGETAMSDINANTGTETDTTSDTTNAAPTNDGLPKKVDDISTNFFVGGDIATKAIPYIQAVQALTNPVVNGDWAQKQVLPEGYGILVLPISKTVSTGAGKDAVKKRVFEHCIVAAVPTLPMIMNYKDKDGKAQGLEYVESAVLTAMQAKLRNGLNRAEDKNKANLAFTVEEFLERAERGAADQGLQAFKDIAPTLVKALAKHNIPVNPTVLRQILQQTKFAEAMFPKVTQLVWQKVIMLGKSEALKANKKPDIFDHWLATRDTAANDTAVDDISFDDGTAENAAA